MLYTMKANAIIVTLSSKGKIQLPCIETTFNRYESKVLLGAMNRFAILLKVVHIADQMDAKAICSVGFKSNCLGFQV